MTNLVLHPLTLADIQRSHRQAPSALLIVGPEGSGKTTIAYDIAWHMLELKATGNLSSYPYFRHIAPDKQTIPIEAIRELRHFSKLKFAGPTGKIRRLALIEQAHTMTSEAQNALLKLLEEPPLDTAFILTANNEQLVLPTIRSRTQQLQVRIPTSEMLMHYFIDQGFDKSQVQQAYLMAGGLPGLMSALLNDQAHPLIETVGLARTIVRASRFERLCQVDSLAKSRDTCLRLVFVLQQMAQAALKKTATANADPTSLRQWHRILVASADAERSLLANSQAKLVLTTLMLTM